MTSNIYLEKKAKQLNIDLDYIIYKDEIKKIGYRPDLDIIINMSNTGHEGTHWVALHTFNNEVVYFDSFGEVSPEEIALWADGKKVIYNDYIIQHLNDTDCGQLCLLFLGLLQGRISVDS